MSPFVAVAALLASSPFARAEPLAWTGPVPADLVAESHYLEVEGHRWHYVEAGEGPPIVLLHGIPANGYLWRNVVPALARDHRVIVPDLLGYGASDKDATIDYHAPAQAHALGAFLDMLAFDQPITLVVSDLGSVTGLYWASQHEERVSGLVLVEAVIQDGESWYRSLPMKMKMMFSLLRAHPKMAHRMLVEQNPAAKMMPAFTARTLTNAELAAYVEPFADPAVRERVLMPAGPAAMPKKGRASPEAPTALMDAFGPWLGTTSLPKLVLAGRPGMLIGPDDVRYIDRSWSSVTVVDVGRGRHFLAEDAPAAISAAVLAWLPDAAVTPPMP